MLYNITIVSTIKQKRAVKLLSENLGKPLGAVMREVGYSKETSETPKNLTSSVGFLEEMKRQGLTNELIARSLSEDIKMKPGDRVSELALGAKMLKMTSGREESEEAPILSIVIAEIAQ